MYTVQTGGLVSGFHPFSNREFLLKYKVRNDNEQKLGYLPLSGISFDRRWICLSRSPVWRRALRLPHLFFRMVDSPNPAEYSPRHLLNLPSCEGLPLLFSSSSLTIDSQKSEVSVSLCSFLAHARTPAERILTLLCIESCLLHRHFTDVDFPLPLLFPLRQNSIRRNPRGNLGIPEL